MGTLTQILLAISVAAVFLALILVMTNEMLNGVYYYKTWWANFILKDSPKLLIIVALTSLGTAILARILSV